MGLIKEGDPLVDSISLYKDKHWLLHLYVLPFFVLYAIWLEAWLVSDFYGMTVEAGMVALAVIFALQVLVVLSCHWSVHIMAITTCTKVTSPSEATFAKVVPTANNGSAELVRVRKAVRSGDVWLVFQKLKYIWSEEQEVFGSLEFPDSEKLSYYLHSKGHEEESSLHEAKRVFGDNKVDMTVPEFMELFKERATAPFFVFQVFCVLLWCLDEYIQYSLFTLFMLVVFECTLVKQQLRNMSEIRNMGNKPFMIQVYRNRRWRPLPSDELVTGDIVSVGRSQSDDLVPCDMLLLRGPCIVDESMLTGEAVPQMKEAIENLSNAQAALNENQDGKLHVLYGGTKIVQHTAPAKGGDGLRAPDNGCIAFVLKTGFNTSQGKLLRTILYGVQRVTANNLETFAFIIFLLCFAIAASSYLWIEGTKDPNRNRYKLFLECTLILTSVVPPELPIELSLAVNTSLLQLTKFQIFCTEPFRIPFAGKVEICCFDKTGTLTSDSLVVEGVAGTENSPGIISIDAAPAESVQVLATCHALVQMEDGLVGDPLEKATLEAMDWTLTKGEAVIPKKGRHPAIKIFHRHHFSSSLKRMSVVAGFTPPMHSEVNYIATVKGAPETLKPMFAQVPNDYDQVYLSLSRRGARVLALGIKSLGQINPSRAKDIPRDELESGLNFAGFIVISCPLKPDSKKVINELMNASHHVAMITGDNPLTACHVAKELKFSRAKATLISSQKGEDWGFESVDQQLWYPWTVIEDEKQWKEVSKSHDLCLTGDGLNYLRSKIKVDRLKGLLPQVRVFARFDPKQKEFVITRMRDAGFTVLMCGDGTNDVGALKHAHVGVAILSSLPQAAGKKDKDTTLTSQTTSTKPLKKIGKRPQQSDSGDNHSRIAKNHNQQLQEMLKELEEQERAQIVKLGDASIAAPFTAKQASIISINHIIKQGRCTLVTTLQMFKILALNALILAYSQSVLYLEGVKFSDGQATLQGILLAACFLFISRSKPLKTLSKQRPLPNIFNMYTIFTVLSQFFVHFGCLLYLVNQAMAVNPRKPDEFPDLEKEFEPNLLNSTVYMISMTLQLATFAINYRGHPFMESLSEHTSLMYSLAGTASFIFVLASGWIPELSEQFSVVEFPEDYRQMLLKVLAIDIVMSFVADRVCMMLFGEGKLRRPK